MSDAPSRILDTSPHGVSARLLGAARKEAAPASSRLRALQIASASSAISAGAALGATRVARGFAYRTWMGLLGVVVVAVTVAVVLFTRRTESPSHPTVANAPTPTTTQPTAAPPPPIEAPTEAPTTVALAPPLAQTSTPPKLAVAPIAPTTSAIAATTSPSAAPSSSAITLADEIARVDAAKHALVAGAPADALALLDRYAADVATPHLAPEAMEVRIEALHALGRDPEACALAKRFLTLYPSSPLSSRARAACPTAD